MLRKDKMESHKMYNRQQKQKEWKIKIESKSESNRKQ